MNTISKESNHSRWLEAHSDRSANLTTLPQCMILADVNGDRDYKLVVADLRYEPDARSRLKVYKGTLLVSDQPLSEAPCSVVSFYSDSSEDKIPAVAVACGSDVLIFRNSKPFFKFTLPQLPVAALEEDVWRKLTDEDETDLDGIIRLLNTLPYQDLSARSQHLLTMEVEQRKEFIGRYVDKNLPVKNSIVTCMATLNKNSVDKDAVACLVVATETGNVYILEPQSFNVVHQANVSSAKSVPSLMVCSGQFDIEFRCVICSRDGTVSLLRRNWLEGKILIRAQATVIDIALVPGDDHIVLATQNKTIDCYSKRGKRLWSFGLPNPIATLTLINLEHLSATLLAVGQRGGFVQIYHDRDLVDSFTAPDTVSAMKFGQLGQEEHVMIIVTFSGSLIYKILKRTADFSLTNLQENTNGIPTTHIKPLPIPKRSKLFVEQTVRERQNAVDIHQTFQQDLIRLRLRACRELTEAQQTSDQSVIGVGKESIKISAQVLGLGPIFTLILTIENMSGEQAVSKLCLVIHCNPYNYKVSTPYFTIPLIVPGLYYKMETQVTQVLGDDVNNAADAKPLKVFVINQNRQQPMLSATISMPSTDFTGL